MTWTQQPENDPRPPVEAPGVVAGVALCHHHGATLTGLRTAHGSEDDWQDRVAAIGRQCRECLEAGGEGA